MKPVLSISLLCSGRKETKKCLDSLKPIMDQVDSELIIVDTGCDEQTRELLAEYTDHIVPFVWCDDFSKARNAGLREAKGEWFLYIDDDEYFADTSEIVGFFRSGEYRKYGQACYLQRNHLDLTGQRYQDMWVSRMIKLSKDTHFTDKIHEYLAPIRGENKLLHNWVEHYGYVFASPEEKKRHDQRNAALLTGCLEEDPGNLRIRAHLAQEYMGHPDYVNMERICRESLERIQNQKDSLHNSYRQTFYMGLLLALLNLGKFDEAKEFFETAIQDKTMDELGRAGMSGIASEIYYRQGDYETCDKCCLEYIRIYNGKNGQMDKVPYSPVFVQSIFYRSNRNNVFSMYMASRVCQKETDALKKYFWEMCWDEENFSIYGNLIPDIVEALAEIPCDDELIPIARKLMEDARVQELTINAIKKTVEKKGEEALRSLAGIFGQAEGQHYYIWYLKVFAAAQAGSKEQLEEAYGMLFQKVVDCLELEDRVFKLADENHLDLNRIFAGIPFDQWRDGVDSFCQKNPLDKVRAKKAYLDRLCNAGEIRYDYFDLKVSEVEAVVTAAEFGYQQIRKKMQIFSDKSLLFYRRFYLPEAFEGEMEMLPASCRAAVVLHRALKAADAGDIAQFRQEITKAIGLFGPLNEGIKNFGKQFADWQEAQLKKDSGAESAAQEMQVLARQVKAQIRHFIEQGEKKTAAGVLQQLKSLTPDDPEISELEELCGETCLFF